MNAAADDDDRDDTEERLPLNETPSGDFRRDTEDGYVCDHLFKHGDCFLFACCPPDVAYNFSPLLFVLLYLVGSTQDLEACPEQDVI
jgi:hypothetical protein